MKARRTDKGRFLFYGDEFLNIERLLKSRKPGTMIIPITGAPPSDKYLPRFLAKMALEAVAMRLVNSDGGIDYIVDHEQLDSIRNYARYAKTGEVWEYTKRRIYEEDKSQKATDGASYQVMNEWDIFGIDDSEFYFVVAIFGIEYAINLGWNCMEGYRDWLKKNNNISPLYYGKNVT